MKNITANPDGATPLDPDEPAVDWAGGQDTLYPVYVHQEAGSAWGATVPDFPGCFSAADDWERLPDAVREAVELYCEGEEMAIPQPGSVETYAKDKSYRGGQWVFINLPFTFAVL